VTTVGVGVRLFADHRRRGELPCHEAGPGASGDRGQLFGSLAAFGNDDLWVGALGDDRVILADPQFVERDRRTALILCQ
jgi:hypothetical protein